MPPDHIQIQKMRPLASRRFQPCAPETLAPGDVVKGNGALWRVDVIGDMKVGSYRGPDGTRQTAMVGATVVDPCNTSLRLGFSKQFVLYPQGGTWERDVTEGNQA